MQLDDRLLDLAAKWPESGKQPEPAELLAFCDGNADLAKKLDACLQGLKATDWMFVETTDTTVQADAVLTKKSGPSIAGYETLERLGAGGMGSVFKARDIKLGRLVAIKTPHAGYDGDGHQRFLREARAAARLRHANICPIHEIGEVEAGPYLAMGYVDGLTLRETAKQRHPTAREAAELVMKLARAVDYAHQHGVIHRDIKPANVLIDAETGEPILTDFGLAKELTDVDSHVTQTGQVMGTPAYMSPEQAKGDTNGIGPGTDVYSLGAVLYELLSGRQPLEGSVAEILRKLPDEEPPPLRKLVPRLHRDVETICMKALAKNPHARYASAAALAADLDRFCAGEAIAARPEGATERLARRIRKRPVTASLVAAAAIVAIVAVASAWHSAHKAHRVRSLRQELSGHIRDLDLLSADQVVARLPAIQEVVSQLGFSPEDAFNADQNALQALARYVETAARRQRLTDDEIPALRQIVAELRQRGSDAVDRLTTQLEHVERGWLAIDSLPTSPERLVAELPGDEFTLDAATVMRAIQQRGPRNANHVVLHNVSATSDMRYEATFAPGWNGDKAVGLLLDTEDGHTLDVTCLAFSPDGQLLASGGRDAGVRLWDLRSGELRGVLPAEAWIGELVFSPSGKTLAASSVRSHTSLWDVTTLQPVASGRTSTNLSSSPNGLLLASALGGHVVVQSIESGEIVAEFDHPAKRLRFLAMMDDQQTLVIVDSAGQADVWNWRDGTQIGSLTTLAGQATCFAASPVAGQVAIGTNDHIVGLCSLNGETRKLEHLAPVGAVVFSPDGSRLFSTVTMHAYLWDTVSGSRLADVAATNWSLLSPTFTPDGQTIVFADSSTVRRWQVGSRTWLDDLYGHVSHVGVVAVDSSGQRIASGGADRTVNVWNANGESVNSFGKSAVEVSLVPKGKQHQTQASLRHRGVIVDRRTVEMTSDEWGQALKLRLERLGGRVRLWINAGSEEAEPDLEFDIVFQAQAVGGLLGLIWPPGVAVESLAAYQRKPAEVPTRLELAQGFFAERNYDAAQKLFAPLARSLLNDPSPVASELWQEARYKEALCLLELKQGESADAIFGELRQHPGTRWPAYAVAQLWARRLVEGQEQEAEQLFADLEGRKIEFRQLAMIIPDNARQRLWAGGQKPMSSFDNWFRYDPKLVQTLKQTYVVEELLRGQPTQLTVVRLARAYRLEGQDEAALELFEPRTQGTEASDDYIDEHAWILRDLQRSEEAARLLDRFIYDDEATVHPLYAQLMIDRARVYVASGARPDLEAALETLNEFLALPVEQYKRSPHHRFNAQLVRGCVLADLGREEEAKQAWSDGFHSFPTFGGEPRLTNQSAWLPFILLAGLSGEMADAELDNRVEGLLHQVGSSAQLGSILDLGLGMLGLRGELKLAFREAWSTPRGRQLAFDCAYQRIPFPRIVRDPPLLIFTHALARKIRPSGAAEEELLWQLSQAAYQRMFVDGALKESHLAALGTIWIGVGSWSGVERQLAEMPDVLGPTAYFLGVRYASKNQFDAARTCFESAERVAEADSPLKRLAQERLENLPSP